jgi:hypothetical protein
MTEKLNSNKVFILSRLYHKKGACFKFLLIVIERSKLCAQAIYMLIRVRQIIKWNRQKKTEKKPCNFSKISKFFTYISIGQI